MFSVSKRNHCLVSNRSVSLFSFIIIHCYNNLAHIIRLEKSCSHKSQPLVRSLSVFSTSSSSPLPISSTNLTSLPLSLPNTFNHPLPYSSYFITPLLPFLLLLLNPIHSITSTNYLILIHCQHYITPT